MVKITRFSFQRFYLLVPVIFAFVVLGCSNPTGSYQSMQAFDEPLLSTQARRAFGYEGVLRNPVIVIHGFLGAKLQDTTGKEVWGTFSAYPPNAKELRLMAHPMAIGKPLSELKGTTVAYSMLEHVNIKVLGFSFSVSGYSHLIDILHDCGYSSEDRALPAGRNFYSQFIFYYDWRRDLQENAARLHEFIMLKKSYLQRHYRRLYGIEDYDVQFDLVAHSMGGLISRYYLRYGNQDLPEDGSMPKPDWGGSKHVDKVIIIATPNAGYADTVTEMVNGLQLAPGAPVYPPALLGTFPSYYQMLPQPILQALSWKNKQDREPIDIFSPQTWLELKWGLVDPQQDAILQILLPEVKNTSQRRKIAFDHLQKCLARAELFTKAMIRKMPPTPKDVMAGLFVGDAVNTVRKLEIDRETGKIAISEYDAGDGKVLAASARFDDVSQKTWHPFINSAVNWNMMIHIKAAHMGIMSSPEFAHNLRAYLLLMTTEAQKELLDRYIKKNSIPAK